LVDLAVSAGGLVLRHRHPIGAGAMPIWALTCGTHSHHTQCRLVCGELLICFLAAVALAHSHFLAVLSPAHRYDVAIGRKLKDV
jgi:hypothetical protein